jgi:hypothetical protein
MPKHRCVAWAKNNAQRPGPFRGLLLDLAATAVSIGHEYGAADSATVAVT